MEQPKQAFLMMEAVNKLAKRNGLGGVFCITNDERIRNIIRRKKMSFEKETDLVASKVLGITEKTKVYVTAADSDADFLR